MLSCHLRPAVESGYVHSKQLNYGSIKYLSRYSDGIRAGRPGFDFRQGQEVFLYSTAFRPVGPTQPPMQWVPKAFSPEVKRQEHEADHALTSSWLGAMLIVGIITFIFAS
jgi:hypothetical protein